MKIDHTEPEIVPTLASKKSSIRVTAKGKNSRSKIDMKIQRLYSSVVGGSSEHELRNLTLAFFMTTIILWQVMNFFQYKSIVNEIGTNQIWSWLSSTTFSFYLIALAMGSISAFVYLTRKF